MTKTRKRGQNHDGSIKLSGWLPRFSREQLDFLKKFPPLFFVPYAAIHFIDLSALTQAVAAFEDAALRALGFASERFGSTLLVDGGAFEIVLDCTGVVMVIMFLALYYSTEIKQRGGAKPRTPWIYVPFLFAFNLARVLATIAVGVSFGASALGAAHFALWFVDSAVVVACWAHAKRIEFNTR